MTGVQTCALPSSEQQEYTWGVTAGGPIVKNKLFFFANYEQARKAYPNTNKIGGQTSNIDVTTANEVLDFMRENYGYTGNFNAQDVFTDSDKAGVKLNWNISNNHQASVRWSMVDAKQLNGTGSATNLYSSDQSYTFESKTNSYIAELQSKFSNALSNEFRASYVSVRDKRNPGDPFPLISIDLGSGNKISMGNDRSSMANSLNQDILSITDNFTWLKGNHSITIGTHNEFYQFENLFTQDLYGSYYFTDKNDNGTALDEFLEGKVNQFRFQQANIDVTGRADWAPKFGAGQVGFYIQDNWQVSERFNFTYGLRADMPLFFDTPTENAGFNDYAAANNWNVKTNHKLSSTPLWSPRAGFRWRTTDRLLLRGGVGIFTGRIPFVWLSNNFSNTGVQFQSYNISKDAYKLGITPIYDPNPALQYQNAQLGSASGSQTINVFSNDFKFAQNARANFAIEYNSIGDIKWTLEGLYSKTLNDILYKNLAFEESGVKLSEKHDLSFDDRPVYQKVTTEGSSIYTNIYELSNTNKGYSYSLSARAEKSFAFGIDFMAAYTYTQSKSLNSGTSSVAASNWNYNYTTGYSNNPELGFSAFNRPHSIKAALSWNKKWSKHDESVISLIYTGESGDPYSVYLNGDANSDGSNGNDLMFIFTDSQIDELVSKNLMSESDANGLKGWLGNDKDMKNNRGKYFERNSANKPFEHHFDLHMARTFNFYAGNSTHKLEISMDIMNIGNLLNKNWGRTYGGNNYYNPVGFNPSTGVYTYKAGADYDKFTYSDFYSRFRGQIGVKYTF